MKHLGGSKADQKPLSPRPHVEQTRAGTEKRKGGDFPTASHLPILLLPTPFLPPVPPGGCAYFPVFLVQLADGLREREAEASVFQPAHLLYGRQAGG